MISLLLLGFLLPIAAYNDTTDPRVRVAYEMIMQKYKYETSIAVVNAAKEEYESQFDSSSSSSNYQIVPYNEILKQYQVYSDAMLQKAGGVIYESFQDLGKNENGEFYIWNDSSRTWQLPNQPAPTTKVDGAALNARILSGKIQLSLQQSFNDETKILWKRSNPFNFFKGKTTHTVLDPATVKLGWWRATFGRARMKTAIALFFKPKIVQIYFGVAGLAYLYYICKSLFGSPSHHTNKESSGGNSDNSETSIAQ